MRRPLLALFAALCATFPSAPACAQDTGGDRPHPVITAIRGKDLAGLRSALTPGLELDAIEDHGQTPLKVAISLGDAQAVEALLKAGASPNARGSDQSFRPPLSFALMGNDPAIVRALLGAGAEVAFRDSFGYSMFDTAFKPQHGRGPAKDPQRQGEIIQMLFDAMVKQNRSFARLGPTDSVRCLDQALCAAARAGDLQWCRTLLDAGANPDAIELRMYTPLMCAVIEGDPRVVALLLERGADPHIALTANRNTALSFAIEGRKGVAVVAALLKHYAPGSPELNVPAADPSSVRARAARAGDAAVVRLLDQAVLGLPLAPAT